MRVIDGSRCVCGVVGRIFSGLSARSADAGDS